MRWVLFATAAGGWLAMSLLADGSPSAQRVEDRVRFALQIGSPERRSIESVRLSGVVSSSGFTGRQTTWYLTGSNAFAVYQDNSFAGLTYGFDGHSAWSRDLEGVVRLETFNPTGASLLNQAYIWTQRLWEPSLGNRFVYLGSVSEGAEVFDRLQTIPVSGRSLLIWVSRRSGLPARFEQPDDLRIQRLDVSDYRSVGGLIIPFRWVSREYGNTFTFEANDVALNPAQGAQSVWIPKQRVTDLSLDRANASVPFEFAKGAVYVKLMLNGRGPFRFMFDTTAENIIDPSVLKALKIVAHGNAVVTGGSHGSAIRYAEIKSMRVGGATLRNRAFWC